MVILSKTEIPYRKVLLTNIHSLKFFFILKSKKMKEKELSMQIVHPNAAGIDIGSKTHWVAVDQVL